MMFLLQKNKINLNQIIALIFSLLILTGSLLLALPVSSRTGGSCGFLTALFTAVSSVCVTGLSLADIWTTFSFFGQLVILLLMEVGGLGFMSAVSVLFYIVNHNHNIHSLSLIAESLGSDGLRDIIRIQKRLLIGSVLFELIGAIILFFSFLPYFDAKTAAWLGIFHSVSAFCNAGFDLMGIVSQGSSLEIFNNNPVVLITIACLIILGGLGFVVWDDIAASKHIRNWSVYTKLVLSVTAVLIVTGSVLFLLIEFNNPESIGAMTLPCKISNSFFQSVTARTAGFAAVSQNNLSDTSIALTVILMFIGGSSGSTAGGIKTVTFIVLLTVIISSMLGKKNYVIFGRTISKEQYAQAYGVAGSFILLSIIGAFVINISSDVSFAQSLFESVSALATVGLSLGITPSLSYMSKIVLILFMYIGRVGLLTLTIGFLKAKETAAIKYPLIKIIIG